MAKAEIPFRTILSIWWSMTWRIPFYVLGTAFFVIIIGMGVAAGMAALVGYGFVGSAEAIDTALIRLRDSPSTILFEWLLWIVASIWALRVSLGKRHNGYKIELVDQPAD